MIRNWYNQIPYPALKTKREITKYINWRQFVQFVLDAQADLSLRWAHRSFCWFCHETTHFKTTAVARGSKWFLMMFLINLVKQNFARRAGKIVATVAKMIFIVHKIIKTIINVNQSVLQCSDYRRRLSRSRLKYTERVFSTLSSTCMHIHFQNTIWNNLGCFSVTVF